MIPPPRNGVVRQHERAVSPLATAVALPLTALEAPGLTCLCLAAKLSRSRDRDRVASGLVLSVAGRASTPRQHRSADRLLLDRLGGLCQQLNRDRAQVRVEMAADRVTK
jgi:hypothetical protein